MKSPEAKTSCKTVSASFFVRTNAFEARAADCRPYHLPITTFVKPRVGELLFAIGINGRLSTSGAGRPRAQQLHHM